jgi:ABC-type multidrug transport system fused ATPase/permease subunit
VSVEAVELRQRRPAGATLKKRSLSSRVRYVRARLGPFGREHRRWLITGTIGTLVVVACRLAFPWPLRGVLELAFSQKESGVVGFVPSSGDPAVWLGAIFIAIVLCQGLAELVQRLSFARFSIGLVHDARAAALDSLSKPVREGESSRDPGDLIARVIGDSARVKAGLKGVLIRMTQNGIFFLGVCIMLLVIDVRLGLVFLAGGVTLISVALFGAAHVSNISRRLRRKEGRLASRMHELLVREGSENSGDLEPIEDTSGRAEAKTTKLEGLTIWAVHAVLGATSCTVVLLGLHLVRTGALQPGDMFTVLFYLLMVHNPTVRLSRQTVRLGRVLASAERLAKVVKRGDERGARRPQEARWPL